jgi:hypothetical protein
LIFSLLPLRGLWGDGFTFFFGGVGCAVATISLQPKPAAVIKTAVSAAVVGRRSVRGYFSTSSILKN